jgi:hypothetical protein
MPTDNFPQKELGGNTMPKDVYFPMMIKPIN